MRALHRCILAPLRYMIVYFRVFVAHFYGSMTRRFLSLIIFSSWLAGAGLLRAEATNAALVKAVVLEGNVAYLRVGAVEKNLGREFNLASTALATTNNIAGVVLDLRFADGDDMSAPCSSNLFAVENAAGDFGEQRNARGGDDARDRPCARRGPA